MILRKYHWGISSIELIGSISVGLAVTILAPKIMNMDVMDSYAASFLWEDISIIQGMDEEDKKSYGKYYDDLLGDGFTAYAVSVNDINSINPLLGDDMTELVIKIDSYIQYVVF